MWKNLFPRNIIYAYFKFYNPIIYFLLYFSFIYKKNKTYDIILKKYFRGNTNGKINQVQE